MIHLLSALFVGSIYGGAYSLRGGKAHVYRISVILLCILLVAVVSSIVWETQIVMLIGEGSWGTVDYAREILIHALWLQSLVCTALSVVALINRRNLKYLAGACASCMLFIVLAYANGSGAMAHVLR